MSSGLIIQVCAQAFSILVGIVSIKKKSISVSGLIALLLISSLFIWLNQVALLIVLFGMFASSSLLTKFKSSDKAFLDDIHEKTGPRDYKQALANLGVATLCFIVYTIYPNELLIAAFVGSVAAGNADSWASEIGVLSSQTPIVITTFKPIKKGMSGGVTVLGLIGGLAGSLFIALLAISSLRLISKQSLDYNSIFYTALLAGVLGCLFDSVLGATIQSSYIDKSSQDLTEISHKSNKLAKGFKFINNDAVNFLTTLFAAIISGVIFQIIH